MIRFPCAGCDKAMNAADEHAGKKAKCPACGEIVVIPRRSILPEPGKGPPAKTAPTKPPAAVNRKPQSAATDDEDGEEDSKPAARIARKPLPPPAKSKGKAPFPEDDDDDIPEVEAVDDDEEEDEDFDEDEEDEEEEEERPRKKKPKKSKKRKPKRSGPYVSCPNCGAGGAFKVYYSFWFGFTPAFLCHVQCPRCGNQYNGNSGGSNTGTLILIQVVITVIVIGVAVLAGVMQALAEM